MTDVMRQKYRELSAADKDNIALVKERAADLFDVVESLGASRETSLAKTKIEEAVMWVVKHITA